MKRMMTILLTISLAGAPLTCAAVVTATRGDGAQFLDRAELLRRIDLYESAATRAEASHVSDADKVRIYTSLGNAYLQATMYLKSEDAMHRAIALLRNGSQSDLADEIGHLATLHVVMGNVKQAEKDQLEALRIREAVGDPIGIALTWERSRRPVCQAAPVPQSARLRAACHEPCLATTRRSRPPTASASARRWPSRCAGCTSVPRRSRR